MLSRGEGGGGGAGGDFDILSEIFVKKHSTRDDVFCQETQIFPPKGRGVMSNV